MIEDAELLRRYAEDRSEPAFAELVQRHLSLVYFAALRQVGGDAHRAHDVAQTVFTDLAKKADRLSRHTVLTGWLYTSTHYAAAKAVRTEQRRRVREQEAHLMQENENPPSSAHTDWDRLRPVLDDVMLELNERDREAVLLRYFEGRPFADVGEKLRLSEDGARMRVDRALDKLRALLTKRGVSSTTAALSLAFANQVGVAAPAGLAATVTSVALTAATGAAGGTAVGWVALFAMNKLPIGITSALAVVGVGGLVIQQNANANLRREIAHLQSQNQEVVSLRGERERLSRTTAEVAMLRQDDAELVRLRNELNAIKARLAESDRAQAAALQAKRRAEEAAKARAALDPTFELKTLDQMPRVTSQSKPVYPTELRKAGVGAEVGLSFTVDSAGAVQNLQVVSVKMVPPPNGSTVDEALRPFFGKFATSAMEAVGQWKFDPGLKNGRMVNTRMQVPVIFSVAGSAATGAPTPQTDTPKIENWF